jgi:DNA-binding PadR family transcriptional regulator
MSELGRRAKIYALTSRGRQQLRTETAAWRAFVLAVGKVIEPA